jgi:hypothetical protein
MFHLLLELFLPEFDHYLADLYLFNFAMATSTSKVLGSGTIGSDVCISIYFMDYILLCSI